MNTTAAAAPKRQVATLTDGTEVEVLDRSYVTRTSGETVLSAVYTPAGVIGASRVSYITWKA